MLPILYNRVENFVSVVMQTANYLQSIWPDELRGVHVEVASTPPSNTADEQMPRWAVNRSAKRITFYRIPIQRVMRLHRNDELHRNMAIESCVFHAIAEYLGKDPWELGGDFGHY